MKIKDILKEERFQLNEAGINYKGETPKTAKILFHDDFDGVMSAVAISMQINKQFGIGIDTMQYAALSDKNYKNANEKLLKKVPGQLLVAVDFNRFDKEKGDIDQLDVSTDHHKQEDGATKGKKQRLNDNFRSDAEHITTKIARGFMNSSDIKAVSVVDSADFKKDNLFVNHTLDLGLALKGEKAADKKTRLAIVSNILLNQIVRAYRTKNLPAVYKIIKEMAKGPTMIKLYSILKREIAKLKLKSPDIRDIEDFKKENKDRVAKSMDVDEKGNHSIKEPKPGEKNKDQTITKDSRFPDIAKNATFGGDGRYDAFLDNKVKAAFRDYGNFWQISKRPASKLDGNLIKISKEAYEKAGSKLVSMDEIKDKFYFEGPRLKELQSVIKKAYEKDLSKIGGHEAISNIGMVNIKSAIEDFYDLPNLKKGNEPIQKELKSLERRELPKALRTPEVKDAFREFQKAANRGVRTDSGEPVKIDTSVEAIEDFYNKNDKYGSKLQKARASTKRTALNTPENKFYLAISNQIAMSLEKQGKLDVVSKSDKGGATIGKRQGAINKFLSSFKTAINYEISSQVQDIINKQKTEKKIEESFITRARISAGITKK